VQSDPLATNVHSSRTKNSFRQYTKFLMVGAMNAVVDVIVLNVLFIIAPSKSQWVLVGCNTVAGICAILNSYYWNRKWTFSETADGSIRERYLFILQAILNILLSDVIVGWISSYLVFSKSVPIYISSNSAKLVAMFLSSSLSYFLMRLFVFRKRRKVIIAQG